MNTAPVFSRTIESTDFVDVMDFNMFVMSSTGGSHPLFSYFLLLGLTLNETNSGLFSFITVLFAEIMLVESMTDEILGVVTFTILGC